MQIERLSSITGVKSASVFLNYDEVRDISNGLYYVTKTHPEYKEISAKCKVLFDMVKHGMIQPETIKKFTELESEGK